MGRAAIAAVAVTAVLVGVGCGGAGDDGRDATEALVLATCAPTTTPVEVRVCRCAYRELVERFDADELARIDRQLRDDPEDVPEAVQEAALSCAFDPVAPPPSKPTTTTTTEPDGDETTTTTDRLP